MKQAFVFLIHAIGDLFVMLVILRFLLQLFRADFRNPLAQGVLQLTSPLVIPLRKLVPPIGKIDTATIVVALLAEFAILNLLNWLHPLPFSLGQLLLFSVIRTLVLTLQLVIFLIFIQVLMSWIGNPHNPIASLIGAVVEPIMRPIRRVIPPLGGLDLSPMVAILGLMAINIVIKQNLPGAFM